MIIREPDRGPWGSESSGTDFLRQRTPKPKKVALMRYRIAFWTVFVAVSMAAFHHSADAGIALIVGAVLGLIGLWIDDETRGDRVLTAAGYQPGSRQGDNGGRLQRL